MWNFWTGFLPFGVGMTITFLLLAVMLIVYVLGYVMLWKDEINEREEKKRKRQEARKAELGRRKTSARRAV